MTLVGTFSCLLITTWITRTLYCLLMSGPVMLRLSGREIADSGQTSPPCLKAATTWLFSSFQGLESLIMTGKTDCINSRLVKGERMEEGLSRETLFLIMSS